MLDADALYALSGRLETLAERTGPTALTPHAGELARLLGRDSAAIADARLASVGEAAERSGAAVLLKGPDTLSPRRASRCAWSRRPCRSSRPPVRATCSRGRSARCAHAGSRPREALALAAVAHGSAARLALSGQGSLIAGDLLLPLGRLLA